MKAKRKFTALLVICIVLTIASVPGNTSVATSTTIRDESIVTTSYDFVASAVIAKIPALDALTLADKALVEDARTKYGAVPEADKDKVVGYGELTEAEGKVEELGENLAKAQEVMDLIEEIPDEITPKNYDEFMAAVEYAESKYYALTEAQKTMVENYFMLEAARKTLPIIIYELGDVNKDGEITVADVVILRSIIIDDIHLGYYDSIVANVDRDAAGEITVSDIVALRALIMGD